MVVCKIVRIRNASTSRFYIEPAGDLFNTPRIGGEPCGGRPFEVPPGAELDAEGLVVPWAAATRAGLVITQEGSSEQVRCVVGPGGADCWDIDWLRLHDSSWEPMLQERWLLLGHRHLLGGVEVLELDLSFHSPGCSSTAGSSCGPSPHIVENLRFTRTIDNAPENTVLLNVYDLASVASVPNAMLCNMFLKGFGAFHAAVEVYGEEWSFFKRANPQSCGVCRSRHARQHPVHVFRQSINMGTTRLSKREVSDLIASDVARRWPGGRYDVIHCNCISFCDELLRLLGARSVPRWVRGLQDAGAAVLRAPQALGSLVQGSFARKHADALLHEREEEEEYFQEVAPEESGQGCGGTEVRSGVAAAEGVGGSTGLWGSVAQGFSGTGLYVCICRAVRRSLGSAAGLPSSLRTRLAALLRPP